VKLAYRIDEFMEAFGVGHCKVYSLLNSGQLEKLKSGRITLISARSVERWMDSCVAAAQAEKCSKVAATRRGAQ
jgi:hypothetical protein